MGRNLERLHAVPQFAVGDMIRQQLFSMNHGFSHTWGMANALWRLVADEYTDQEIDAAGSPLSSTRHWEFGGGVGSAYHCMKIQGNMAAAGMHVLGLPGRVIVKGPEFEHFIMKAPSEDMYMYNIISAERSLDGMWLNRGDPDQAEPAMPTAIYCDAALGNVELVSLFYRHLTKETSCACDNTSVSKVKKWCGFRSLFATWKRPSWWQKAHSR